MNLLKNKKALITGGGRGIGRAIALLFAQEGAEVWVTARSEGELNETVREIKSAGGCAHALAADLSIEKDIEKVSQEAEKNNIDILVNNAGTGFKGAFHKSSHRDVDVTLNVNLRAPMLLTKNLLPLFFKKESAVIINIVSIAGKMGMADSVTYCASKHGMMGFTHALFEEVREKNIKVSAICPGFVDTALIPETRKMDRSKMIRPADIAKAALFIATASRESCPLEMTVRPQQSPRT
ncbi:MAG TPA: SDR family oxidoreductase [Bdellovibrionota bacterium]|nr:SDR family oxidoreductase [Bdellovibrionota bacterium]